MTSGMQRMLTRRKTRMEKDEMPSEDFIPRYEKPKILLIDLPEDVLKNVKSAGFNVSAGTFGSPYKVPKSDGYYPVIFEYDLPNFSEQEIIFIDLTAPKILDNPPREKLTSDGELDWWAKASRGEIDPRPKVLWLFKDYADRILQHGGFFVIFAQPHLHQDLIWAKVGRGELIIEKNIDYDIWSLLSILSLLNIEQDFGEEITIIDIDSDDQILRFLRKFINDL